MRINIAITGATGSIYARLLAQRLLETDNVEFVRLIFTTNGMEVTIYEEGDMWINELKNKYPEKVELVSNSDYYCSLASGSGNDDALVIAPCSMGMLSRVANGISDDLISRGADVMLKERRKLIMLLRESPFNLIHIQNMATLTTAGAIIVPASPSFYSKPQTIEELCNTTVDIIIRQLGIKAQNVYNWGK